MIERELPNLEPDQQNVLEDWTREMAKHWAVMNAAGIKEVARLCCSKAVKTYLEGAGLSGKADAK
jgi:hypothetical protein